MWRLLPGTMGVKSLVQGLNTAATAGSNRGPFDPKSDAVTDWPLRLHTRARAAVALGFEVTCPGQAPRYYWQQEYTRCACARGAPDVQCIQLFFPQTLLDFKKIGFYSISRKFQERLLLRSDQRDQVSKRACREPARLHVPIGCTYAMTERKASSLHEKRYSLLLSST